MIRFPVPVWFNNPFKLTNPNSLASNQWFGRATLANSDTGGYSIVVSTTLINSNSLIFPAFPVAQSQIGSNASAPAFFVSCIAPGGFFKLQNVSSVAVVGSFSVGWMIVNPR